MKWQKSHSVIEYLDGTESKYKNNMADFSWKKKGKKNPKVNSFNILCTDKIAEVMSITFYIIQGRLRCLNSQAQVILIS